VGIPHCSTSVGLKEDMAWVGKRKELKSARSQERLIMEEI